MTLQQTRANMIEQQIRTWEVLDEKILALYEEVWRENFVPDNLRDLAYSDTALPIGHGQYMLEPKLEARMLQALALHKNESVLHVGTGSGFFAALLGHLAGQVLSVEIIPDLAVAARARLAAAGLDNVAVMVDDGACGVERGAPFDAVVLTGSTPIISPNFGAIIKDGGRLLAVEGEAPVMTLRLVYKRSADMLLRRDLLETCLPPLQNAPHPPSFQF